MTHSPLQLAEGDTIKAIKSMRDAFDKAFEWNKPIKYSPKKEGAVNWFSKETASLSKGHHYKAFQITKLSFKNCGIKFQREE